MRRRHTGPAPALRLPKGAVDTQTHVFLPGFPARPGGPDLPPPPCPAPTTTARSWRGSGSAGSS